MIQIGRILIEENVTFFKDVLRVEGGGEIVRRLGGFRVEDILEVGFIDELLGLCGEVFGSCEVGEFEVEGFLRECRKYKGKGVKWGKFLFVV